MNDETAAPEPVPSSFTNSESQEPDAPKPPTVASVSRRARPPAWLPFLLLAVVPALVVGILVYVLAGNDSGGGGSTSGAGILDGFFRLGPSSDGDVTSFKDKLPPDFPKEFPLMSGEKVVASFQIVAKDSTNYFAVLSGPKTPDEIYDYYLGILDKDPWQIEVARAAKDFTGVRFSRPDNPDISGDVTVHHSDLDNKTVTYVSLEDSSKKQGSSKKPADAFKLSASRELPPGFPNDIPIYKGRGADSVVTDTYFERGQGGKNFIVSFLTKDGQDDVLKFYRDEFGKRGWTVKDGTSGTRFQLSIDFNDASKGEISGSVRTDQFDDDPSYNEISLVLQVSGRRARGN